MRRGTKRKKTETEFEKIIRKIDRLTELVQEEFHATYERLTSVERRLTLVEGRLTSLEEAGEKGFARLERRFDAVIQPQLDEHALRIKKLEQKVLS